MITVSLVQPARRVCRAPVAPERVHHLVGVQPARRVLLEPHLGPVGEVLQHVHRVAAEADEAQDTGIGALDPDPHVAAAVVVFSPGGVVAAARDARAGPVDVAADEGWVLG